MWFGNGTSCTYAGVGQLALAVPSSPRVLWGRVALAMKSHPGTCITADDREQGVKTHHILLPGRPLLDETCC